MAKNRYVSVSFRAGVKQNIPKNLLPLPFLTRAQNLVIEEEGQLVSRPNFKQVSGAQLPPSAPGDPLKIFTRDQQLYAITTRDIFSFVKSEAGSRNNGWRDFITGSLAAPGFGRLNFNPKVFNIAQREMDIQNLAFSQFGTPDPSDPTAVKYLCCFYTLAEETAQDILRYSIFSIPDQRVVINGSRALFAGTLTNLYAYWNKDNQLWVAGAHADGFQAFNFNPIRGEIISTFSNTIKDIGRFRIFKDRCFYIDETGTIKSFVYNATATEKATENEITSIRDPSAHSVDNSGRTLYDFHDYVNFSYGDVDFDNEFRIIWSPQTGYFVLNSLNNIVGHFYANSVPYTQSTPQRIKFLGEAFVNGTKVYVPILRSGQAEVVNTDAVNDAIVPDGPQGGLPLGIFRPLGLDILEMDFSSKEPPLVADIDKQTLLSGPIMGYTDGHRVNEFGFTERPRIVKSDIDDYDRWAYSDLDVNLPTIGELERDQYRENTLNYVAKTSPYLVEGARFTARTDGDKTGAVASTDWASTATTANRTLRFSSKATDGTIDDSYDGVLSLVYYDTTEKALVAEFTSAPSTQDADKDRPQAIQLNGIRYDFQHWSANGDKAYHFDDTSPITAGTTYTAKIPKAQVIVNTDDPQDVQLADTGNRNTNIKVDETRLRRYSDVRVSRISRVEGDLSTSNVQFGYLNQAGHRGYIETAIRTLVGVTTGGKQDDFDRDSGNDIAVAGRGTWTTPQQAWRFGNHLWVAYSKSGELYDAVGRYELVAGSWTLRAFDTPGTNPEDFNVPNINFDIRANRDYRKAFKIDNTLWLSTGNSSNIWEAYDFSTDRLVRASSKDFDITDYESDADTMLAVFVHNQTLYGWLDRGSGNRDGFFRAFDYSAGNFTENTTKRFNPGISGNPDGAVKIAQDDETVWIVDGSSWVAWHIGSDDRFRRADSSLDKTITFDFFVQGIGDDFYLRKRGSNSLEAYARDMLTLSDGVVSSPALNDQISLAGLWVVGNPSRDILNQSFMVFKAKKTDYATSALLDTAIKELLSGWRLSVGDLSWLDNITHPASGVVRNTSQGYTDTDNVYIRYDITPLGGGVRRLARSIVYDDTILEGTNLNVTFRQSAKTSYDELTDFLAPRVFSAIYSGFDENNMAKELDVTQVNSTVQFFLGTNRNESNSFFLNDSTFQKVKGPVATNNYYYFATTDNPLDVQASVFDFDMPNAELIFRYPLVEARPVLTTARTISARVYNYLCVFKWIDANGIEHRSQRSNRIQLISNTDIGGAGNQPTFQLNNLNLTDRGVRSIGIEVYRTRSRGRSYHFLKEVQGNTEEQFVTMTDDVIDDKLGAPIGPNKFLVSGAKYVTTYRGHFVLWGFPDQPNRVLVSSPRRPFNNLSIGFDRSGLAGDAIPLLMEQEVTCCQQLDSYLLIFCKGQAYSWAINTRSAVQKEPSPVTGLSNISARSQVSAIGVTDGLLFEAEGGKGIHLLTRGLAWRFEGEPVKLATKKGAVLSQVRKEDTDDVIIVKESNPDAQDQPNILVYNERYKQWTSYSDKDLVSATLWEGKFTGLNNRGEIWQESEDMPARTRTFVIETGWVSFNEAYMNFKRVRDIYLLAEFEGLESLTLDLDSDFVDGNNAESITGRVTGSMFSIGGMSIPVQNLKVFRFQPRNQQVQALRLKITVSALTAKFDSLRFGLDAGPGITGQQGVRGSVGPVTNVNA